MYKKLIQNTLAQFCCHKAGGGYELNEIARNKLGQKENNLLLVFTHQSVTIFATFAKLGNLNEGRLAKNTTDGSTIHLQKTKGVRG